MSNLQHRLSTEGFLPGPKYTKAGDTDGILSDLTFAVKDNIDLEGCKTGAGNPFWADTHPIAEKSANIVNNLLVAGASIEGKTITEELAYSVIGDNKHFGIPVNAATPDRFPGGSSSGSASVVSSGAVDFALGTDTAGSIRIPASNCGIFGIRPTHGCLSMAGILPLARSFDTVGWFATDAKTLQRVGNVLLPAGHNESTKGYCIYEPALKFLSKSDEALFREALDRSSLPRIGSITKETIWPERSAELVESLRVLQAAEAWHAHGEWVLGAPGGALGEDIRERFYAGRDITEVELQSAKTLQDALIADMGNLLEQYEIIAIPTVNNEALRIDASDSERLLYRQNVIQITCLSSLTGLPELSMPLINKAGARMGVSLLARPEFDRALLGFVANNIARL